MKGGEETMSKSEYNPIFAEKIRFIRISKKMTQEEFSELLSCSQQTINVWEQAKSIPSAPMLVKIADTFNVTIDWLLGRISISPPSLAKDIKIQQFENTLKKLNPDGENALNAYIAFLLSQKQYTEKEKVISA